MASSFVDHPSSSDTQLDDLEEGLEAEIAAAEARLADSRNRPFGMVETWSVVCLLKTLY
jgi:hypothetical protein